MQCTAEKEEFPVNMNEDNEKNGGTKKTLIIGEFKQVVDRSSTDEIIHFAVALAKKQGYGEERIDEMKKAFKEIAHNIVHYAFQGAQGNVEISCTLDRADRMVFKIMDAGTPFNMLLAGDPLFAEEYTEQGLEPPSAKMTKRFCETVEYQRLDNRNYLFTTFSGVAKSKK